MLDILFNVSWYVTFRHTHVGRKVGRLKALIIQVTCIFRSRSIVFEVSSVGKIDFPWDRLDKPIFVIRSLLSTFHVEIRSTVHLVLTYVYMVLNWLHLVLRKYYILSQRYKATVFYFDNVSFLENNYSSKTKTQSVSHNGFNNLFPTVKETNYFTEVGWLKKKMKCMLMYQYSTCDTHFVKDELIS